MNTEALHAIDALYLENFLQTLLYRACEADGELRECLRHAELLSSEENLSEDCRSRYVAVVKRLRPLLSELKEMEGDLHTRGKLASDCEPLVQWGCVESVPEYEARAVHEQLNLAEREVITTLNHIGTSLFAKPEVNVSWSSQVRVKGYLKLKPIPARPCYQHSSLVRFCANPPYQTAHYFAELPGETNGSRSSSPWLLDSDFSSLIMLPLFEDIEIELEVRGDLITSWHDPKCEVWHR